MVMHSFLTELLLIYHMLISNCTAYHVVQHKHFFFTFSLILNSVLLGYMWAFVLPVQLYVKRQSASFV